MDTGAEPCDSILVVEAEVLAAAPAMPPPGFTRALQVDRYRVLRIVQGQYDHEELYAARDAGDPFAIGDQLRLTLSRDLPEAATPVIDDSVAVSRFGLYFVISFSRL